MKGVRLIEHRDIVLRRMSRRWLWAGLALAIYLVLQLGTGAAAAMTPPQQQIPDINISLGEGEDATNISLPLQIFLLMTVLSLVPSIVVMLTSFTRLVIVFHFLRQAMGTQSMPPNQVVLGMALFLTVMIMWPVGAEIWVQAVEPYNTDDIDAWEALSRAEQPIRDFMRTFIREKDLALFLDINNMQAASFEDVPTYIVVPAFMLSEVKTAFEIGFLLFLPFLILDMVVASVLLSMGMIMLPPVLISLPFKLLIFILVDGWYLVIGSMVKSFVGG